MNTEENTSVESTDTEVTWNNVTDDVNLSDYAEEPAETTESQEETSEVDSSNEPVTETNDDDYEYVVEVDGKEYTLEEVSAWKTDAENKDAWSAKNTQTAQSLASLNNLSKELAENEGLRNHLKDFYSDDTDKLNKLNLDNMMALEVEKEQPKAQEPNPLEQKVDKLSSEMREVAIDRRQLELEHQLDGLEKSYPQLLGDQKTLEFLKFATDKGYTNIESAFKDWSFPKMQEIIANQEGLAKNVNRNKGKVVNKSNAGSKGVVKDSKLKDWNSANMSNPDVKKYFE